MFSLTFPGAAVWRASSPFSCSEAMIHCNGECFHSVLAFCSNLTSMKIKIGLGVLLWTLIFKCNLKIFFCSAFVMKDMYGKSKEDVWWESHFPLLELGFHRINKAAFSLLRYIRVSSWLSRPTQLSTLEVSNDWYVCLKLELAQHTE